MAHSIACGRLLRPRSLIRFIPSHSIKPLHRHLSMPSPRMLGSLVARFGLSQPPRSAPRTFPVAGFDAIGEDQLVEEETIPEYHPEHFYPVRLGEVFNDRFQTVAKLGYGSSSTIWLARDLQQHQYVALKIYIHNSAQHRELPFYERLDKFLPSRHPGAKNVRKLLTSFEVAGPHGKHVVLALQVSQMSIRDMDTVFMNGRGFSEGFVKGAVQETLLHIQWSYPVDIWSVGLTAWDLLEGKTLFSARKEDGSFSDGVHFAELIAALGPPPRGLLDRHRNRALEYWDEHGNWDGFVPIPQKTLEAAETKLEDNTKFLQFLRRALAWDPDARPTTRQLLQDPWLVD